MATSKRSNVAEALSKLWAESLNFDRSDDTTRAIAVVIDALEHASQAADKAGLRRLELEARRYLGTVATRLGPVVAPMRHELVRALLAAAKAELGKVYPPKARASAVAGALIMRAEHHLLGLGERAAVHSTARFHELATEEIRAALSKREDAEDVVVALLVAYGIPRAKARRNFVQSALRRRD